MKLKINWGWGIAAVYTLFALGMIYLVTLCTHQNIDLVSTNYYEKEVKYQEQYDKEKNALALPVQVAFDIDNTTKKVTVTFPTPSSGALKGQILFQKTNDAAQDRTLAVKADSARQEISFKGWGKGLYKIELNWSDGPSEYYKQTYLNLN